MKLKELKKIINGLDDKYSDTDILVDTEAARFNVHMVEITDVSLIDDEYSKNTLGRPFINVQLDDEVKTY